MDVVNNYGLYTASVGDGAYTYGINTKYYNEYKNGKYKIGDAMIETKGWHGSLGGDLTLVNSTAYTRTGRTSGLSIFSADRSTVLTSGSPGKYTARAIMICGEGI